MNPNAICRADPLFAWVCKIYILHIHIKIQKKKQVQQNHSYSLMAPRQYALAYYSSDYHWENPAPVCVFICLHMTTLG